MTILAVLIFLITGNTNIFESKAMFYTYMADAAASDRGRAGESGRHSDRQG